MKKKSQVWIVFSVNNQNVHQITDNGCTSMDVIIANKEMVANKHGVSIQEVKNKFVDSPVQKTSSIISSQMRKELVIAQKDYIKN